MNVEHIIKRIARSLGVDVMAYKRSVPARRVQLLRHLGVELLVDVGANIGQYAMEVRRNGYRGAILSIEPLADAYARLERAARGTPEWDTLRLALGAHSGVMTLYVSDDDVYTSARSVRTSALEVRPSAASRREESVPVDTLDAVLARRPAVDALAVKIDVQGFEREVLDGAASTLERAVLVEMELSPTPIYEGQMLLREALQRMEALNLSLALVENVFADFTTGRALQINGIFVRSAPEGEGSPTGPAGAAG